MKARRETMEVDGVKCWKCAGCGEFKPAEGFFTKTRKGGAKYPLSYCKQCATERSRDAMKAWRERRREEQIASGVYREQGRPRGSRNKRRV